MSENMEDAQTTNNLSIKSETEESDQEQSLDVAQISTIHPDPHINYEKSITHETETISPDLEIKQEKDATLNFNDISINKYKDNILSDMEMDESIFKTELTEELLIGSDDVEKQSENFLCQQQSMEDNDNNTVVIKQETHELVHCSDSHMKSNPEYDLGYVAEKVKLELTEDVMVSYDPPDFDCAMSDDENTLDNVEAPHDISIKNEKIPYEDGYKFNLKQESDYPVTETQLISNKLINTTSTVTHCADGITEAHTTQTLVMEIHSIPCKLPCSEEEILPTMQTSHDNINDFQLNSITGNVLSLAQEALGLLEEKEDLVDSTKKLIKCPKCVNCYRTNYALKKHLEVHDSIDRYANGRMRGWAKRRERENEKRKQKIKPETKTSVKKENEYKCTCGNTFGRRTRMEACMRTHESVGECSSYSCITCAKHYKNKDDLQQHRKRVHSRKRFLCKFCPTEYKTRKGLFKHLRKHQKVQLMEYKVISEVVEGKEKLKCFFCSKVCADLMELKSHILGDHKEPYKCRKCTEKFKNLSIFATHSKNAHPDAKRQPVLDVLEALSELAEEWKCDDCHLQFMEAEKLAVHKLEQHSETKMPEKEQGQFQCPHCLRAFASSKSLNSHRRIHTENTSETVEESQPGILCLHCRKICKDENGYNAHMRFHSPERKYVCKYCDFRFATSEKRKTHSEIHTGDLKFVCFICEYQCSSIQRLNAHKAGPKHLSMKDFLLTGLISTEQSKGDKIRETLKNDEQEIKKSSKKSKLSNDKEPSVVGSEKVPCDVCGETFPSETIMLQHKETHPFIEFPNDDKPSRIFFK